jgi:dihydroorotase (multifunctional complex type)
MLIKNGNAVIPYVGIRREDIGIKDGIIAALAEEIDQSQGDEIVDAKGMFIFPGVVDPHTHMGTTLPFMEDFESETISAAYGGVTTLLTTLKLDAFSQKAAPDENVFWDIVEKTNELSSIDYSFSIFVSHDQQIEKIPYYFEKCGIQSYKFSMTYKDRKISPGLDEGKIFKLLRTIAAMDNKPLPMVHAEADEIINIILPEVRKSGMADLEAWNCARPNFTEELAILKMAYLSKITRVPLYIVHISTEEGTEVASSFRRRGAQIIGETCLHYLTLTVDRGGILAKMNPPVRTVTDREALWDALKDGIITCVGTDHGAKRKEHKGNSIWEATVGFPGMETFFPLMLTEGIKRGISPTGISEIVSANNARTFGLFPRKGTISIGSDADLVIMDMENKVTLRAENLHSAADFTPYEGMEVDAWPVTTILRGKIIVKNNELITKGQGEFVPRFPGAPDETPYT